MSSNLKKARGRKLMSEDHNVDANASRCLGSEPALQFQPTRFIIIERRAFIRECIASYLRTLPRKVEVLCGVGSAEDLPSDELACADIILLCVDWDLAPNESVQHQIAWLLHNRSDAPIILVSDTTRSHELKDLFSRFMLRAHVSTSSNMALVEAVLELVIAGGTYVPTELAKGDGTAAAVRTIRKEAGNLTARERSVLSFLREGKPNKLIAHSLGISQSTVKAHIHNIMLKCQSRNRTQAAVLAGESLIRTNNKALLDHGGACEHGSAVSLGRSAGSNPRLRSRVGNGGR
jgi:DNA-binding NarL/FixJ family response regulator